MKKKFFARALALVMSLSLLSTVAFAAPVAFDPDWHVGEDGSLLAHKEEQADGTFSQSYDYYLDKDIELDKTLTIKNGANASIDLNGYNLSLNKDLVVDTEKATVTAPDDAKVGSVIEVTGEGTSLTVTDNSDGANGTISGGYNPGVSPAGFGGGIKVDGNASLDLQGGTITNNVAANGGGVYVGKGTVEMSGDAKIDGNLAIMNGGGVFLNTELASRTDDEAVFTMNGGTISNNTASGKDANGNIVGGGGGIGAVLYKESPDPEYNAIVVNGGTITGNKAEVGGAGIYVTNGKVSITDATISNNVAAAIQGNGTTQNGGGIYATGAKTEVTVTDSTISGNTANSYGGGIYAGSSTLNVTGTDILNNTASTMWGGGVYAGGAQAIVTLTGNTISGNHADAQVGGGIGVYNSTVIMNGNNVSGNSAAQGGGIYAQGNTANVTMNSGSITGNTVTNAGGGVRLATGATFTMNGGSITGNNATSGAGVYSYNGTTFVMDGGEITGNAATGNGGGVFNHTADFTMTGGKLYGNNAGTSSDDIYSDTRTSGSITLITAEGMEAEISGETVSRWLVDSSNIRAEDGYVVVSFEEQDAVLRLKAAPAQYFTLTVDDGYSEDPQSTELERNSAFPTIEDPTRDGYTFLGWNINLPETVTGNITLTAQWEEIPTEPEQPEIPEEPETPETPEDPGVIIPDPDVPLAGGPDADTATIEDEAVPLAGIVTLAEMLEELRQREEIAEIELPEDFKFIDHDYAQALYWALAEDLVADTEEEPLDPDEIVTVGLMQKVLDSYVGVYKSYADFVVTVDGESDEMVMDLGERLTVFYGELEQYEAAAEAEAK